MNRSGSELPYNTGNAALAFSLYLAGVPFADPKTPLVNIYSAGILKSLGYAGNIDEEAHKAFARGEKGQVEYGFKRCSELSDCIKAFDSQQSALKRDLRVGSLIVPEIMRELAGGLASAQEALCRASCVTVKRWRAEIKDWEASAEFRAQRNRNAANEQEACEAAHAAFLTGDFYKFAAVILDARRAFLDLFKLYMPQIRRHRVGRKSGKLDKLDGGTIKLPSFVAYSQNAEPRTKKELGV